MITKRPLHPVAKSQALTFGRRCVFQFSIFELSSPLEFERVLLGVAYVFVNAGEHAL